MEAGLWHHNDDPGPDFDYRSPSERRDGKTAAVGAKDRGPRPKVDLEAQLQTDLYATFRWLADRTDNRYAAEPTGWWADPSILRRLGPALAEPGRTFNVTHVVGPQSRGGLLGALVAVALGVGLVELRKDPHPSTDSDRWLTARTPPDYQDRNLRLGLRRDLLPPGSRVLFVDDWIDTGGQAVAARRIVDAAQASWCGASVIVDALTDARLRRDLAVSSIFRDRDLSRVP